METPLTPEKEPEFFARLSFPDCELHYCEQRTDEWLDLRRGVLTASEFGPWLTKDGKTPEKSRHAMVCKKLAEIAGCEMAPVYETWAMERGTNLEEEAVESFMSDMDVDVEPIGFALHKSGVVGCSPDGLLRGNVGFEGKAPLPPTHVRYVLDGGLPPEYRDQVHGSMAVTGAKGWWFQSYCPGLPSLRVYVERDSYTEQVLAGLLDFADELEKGKARLAELWEAPGA